MLTGAGVVLALDNRYPNSLLCLNGLLQSTSYIAGISGGSWLVMSNFINDFEPIHKLKDLISEKWDLEELLLQGVPNFDTSELQKDQQQQQQQNLESKINTKIKSKECLVVFWSCLYQLKVAAPVTLMVTLNQDLVAG